MFDDLLQFISKVKWACKFEGLGETRTDAVVKIKRPIAPFTGISEPGLQAWSSIVRTKLLTAVNVGITKGGPFNTSKLFM